MAHYSEFDLDRLKAQLSGTDWEVVLPVFAPVRLATPGQVLRATRLGEHAVRQTLKVLATVKDHPADPAQPLRPVLAKLPTRVAHLAWEPTPSSVYQLGPAGAALLRERGLLQDTRPGAQTEPVAVAHSLCLLDLVLLGQQAGQARPEAERVFTNGAGDTIRADIAVPGADGSWRLLEVERQANEDNYPRRARRLQALYRFFGGPGGPEQVSPEILFLFNVRLPALGDTTAEWQAGLDELQRAHARARLPFTLRAMPLADFMSGPFWTAPDQAPILTPAPAAKPKAEPFIDPLALAPAEADFAGFFAQAAAIYTLSRGRTHPTQFYSVPKGSLQALRDLLAGPAWQADRQHLAEGLGLIKPYMLPPSAATLLNKLLWEIVLRHYGIDRGHIGTSDFQVTVVTQQAQSPSSAGYGDFAVEVQLSPELYDTIAPQVPGQPEKPALQTMAEWMLGAFYTYAYELGLRPVPWWHRLPLPRGQRRKGVRR